MRVTRSGTTFGSDTEISSISAGASAGAVGGTFEKGGMAIITGSLDINFDINLQTAITAGGDASYNNYWLIVSC